LTSTLSSYVTNSSLTSTLSSYLTSSTASSTYAKLSGSNTYSNNNTFNIPGSVQINCSANALTPASGDNSTNIATTAFVNDALTNYVPIASISSLIGSSASYTSNTGIALCTLCNHVSGMYYVGIWQTGAEYYYPTSYFFKFTYFNTNNINTGSTSGQCSGSYVLDYGGGSPAFHFRSYSNSGSYSSYTSFTRGDANFTFYSGTYNFSIYCNSGSSPITIQARQIL
jgi:hypothetical protein